MKSIIAINALFAAVMAAPSYAVSSHNLCPRGLLYSSPQCCADNVLNLVDLDCQTPREFPKNGENFTEICAKEGGRAAMCCSVPAAGQALLCTRAIGGW